MDKLTVFNRALGFLNERVITNPDAPETPAGKHIAGIFDQGVKEVLRIFPWNFAEVWATAPKTTAPSFGYSDAYSLPTDFIRLLIVGYSRPVSPGSAPMVSRRDFRMLNQGAPDYRRVIAIDNSGAETLQIAYTAYISQLHIWDPLAIKVLARWLALDAAKAVTGQDDLVKQLNDLLKEDLRDAAGVDGGEQAIQLHEESYVQNARDMAQYGDMLFTPVQYP